MLCLLPGLRAEVRAVRRTDMQELEKILEEMNRQLELSTSREYRRGWNACKERMMYIIRKHMNDGWIPIEDRLPDEYDGLVLAQVSGKPRENITLNNALQLACYISEAGEGWIVEEYPEWENPNVIAWRPLPEPYRPERSEGE